MELQVEVRDGEIARELQVQVRDGEIAMELQVEVEVQQAKIPVGRPNTDMLQEWANTNKKRSLLPLVTRLSVALEKMDKIITGMANLKNKDKTKQLPLLQDTQRGINLICSTLRNRGASEQYACNIIPPNEKTHVQGKRRELVNSRQYDPSTGSIDPAPDRETMAVRKFVFHGSSRLTCSVDHDLLVPCLVSGLERSRIAPIKNAYRAGGTKEKFMTYKEDLLVPCPCMTTPGKQDFCAKMIWTKDPYLLGAMTPEQADQWNRSVKDTHHTLIRAMYRDPMVIDTCPGCHNSEVNTEYVEAADKQIPYTNSNMAFCKSVECAESYCRICRKIPYHTNQDCQGYTSQALDDLIRDAETEEERVRIRLNTKACPGCRVPVEKVVGTCKIMKCKCNLKFCFGCMAMVHPNFDHVHTCSGDPTGPNFFHDRARLVRNGTINAYFVEATKEELRATIPDPPRPYVRPPGVKQVFYGGVHNSIT